MFSCNVLYVKELNINKNNDFNLISANCGLMEYDELSNSYTILSFDNKKYNIELEWYSNLNSRKRIPQNSNDLQKYLLCEDNDFTPPHSIKINLMNIDYLKLPKCIIIDCITAQGSVLNLLSIKNNDNEILIDCRNVNEYCVLLINEYSEHIISKNNITDNDTKIMLSSQRLIHGIIDKTTNIVNENYSHYVFEKDKTIIYFNNKQDLINSKILFSYFIRKKLKPVRMPFNHNRIIDFVYNIPVWYSYIDNFKIIKCNQYLNCHTDKIETIFYSNINEKNIILYLPLFVENIDSTFNDLFI